MEASFSRSPQSHVIVNILQGKRGKYISYAYIFVYEYTQFLHHKPPRNIHCLMKDMTTRHHYASVSHLQLRHRSGSIVLQVSRLLGSILTISVRQAAVAAQRTMTFQYGRPLEQHS